MINLQTENADNKNSYLNIYFNLKLKLGFFNFYTATTIFLIQHILLMKGLMLKIMFSYQSSVPKLNPNGIMWNLSKNDSIYKI